MQKNEHFYTFLFKHSTKSKNYVRRIEVSKKLLHTSAGSLVILAAVAVAVFIGFVKNTAQAKTETQINNAIINQPIENKPKAEYKSINYARPEASAEYSGDGTEVETDAAESDADNNIVNEQIRTIVKTSSPAFLPTMWAHYGKINNEYGFRRNPFGGRAFEFHPGLDIDGDTGDTVVAPANGIVTKAGWQGGYGNMVEIDHGNGLITRYGHLSRLEIQAGDAVQRGQLIGLVGSTGRSTGAHLHFEIRLNDRPINPRRFLPVSPEIAALTNH